MIPRVADDQTADLGELLMRAARSQRGRWRDVLAPWDLSPHQGRALGVVCRGGEVRISALAEGLRIAPRSATEVVDGLEQRGLVERAPDPADRRAVIVRPTPAGERVRSEIDAARAADSRTYFEQLPAEDRAALARILRSLVD
jgi:DNA-binding MarR family transcriptional regulator